MPFATATAEQDLAFMQIAKQQALQAENAGEVPVGAILISPVGVILATGKNQVLRESDPTAHAEVVAMREAGRELGNYRLMDCTLYCTLEPCAMCAGAMIHARIGRLVYAARDPKAGACGSALEVMNHPALNHHIEVTEGVLAEECSTMLRRFFQARRGKVFEADL